MNNDEEEFCFETFWKELFPDCTAPIIEYSNGLADPSRNQISLPIPPVLNGDMRYPEFDDDKFPIPQDIEKLPPDMPVMLLVETDQLESDDCFEKALPAPSEDELSLNEGSSFEAASPKGEETCFDSLSIPCLESIQSLEKKCENLGLKLNICSSSQFYGDDAEKTYEVDEKTYEVDIIYSHKVVDHNIYYFVKWKNYATASNTWEPSWHLEGCSEMIQYYHAMKSSRKQINKNVLNYFVRDLISRKPCDILTLIKVCAVCFGASEKHVLSLKLTIPQMKSKVREILMLPAKKLKKIEDKLFRIMQFGEARKQTLINLKEWECHINAENFESAYVSVENQVDLELAPSGFKFIKDYINDTNYAGPSEPVIFCKCEEGCYKRKNMCCPNDSDGKFAYNHHKKLILEPGYPIFECNDRCSCPKSCINRVVQHGPKVKVAIFRTLNKGWGLKTLETIEKGQFVLEYLGEIITWEAAEARGHIYDYVGRSYLFDLDYGVDNSSCYYTVDAGHVGNAAHFINHSCDPNLHVFAVWINQQDPHLPRLAFFAKRKVSKGEELTFDYKMTKDRFDGDNPTGEEHRILCRCHSKNCRKYLF